MAIHPNSHNSIIYDDLKVFVVGLFFECSDKVSTVDTFLKEAGPFFCFLVPEISDFLGRK